MGTLSLNTHYRPLRIGLCVEDGDVEGLKKATQYSVLLWGGSLNPIIPVSEDSKLADNLCAVFNVDYLFNVTGSQKVKAYIDSKPELRAEAGSREDLVVTADLNNSKKLVPLDLQKAIDWDIAQLSSTGQDIPFSLIEWDDGDEFDALFHIDFGKLNNDFGLKIDYRQYYLSRLNAENIKIPKGPLDGQLAGKYTPYESGNYKIWHFRDGGGFDDYAGIFIGDPNKFHDLLTYWNLKAAGETLQFCPLTPGRLYNYVQSYIKKLGDEGRFSESRLAVWYNRETTDEELEKALNSLKIGTDNQIRVGVDTHSWNGRNIRVSTMHIREDSILANLDMELDRPTISFQLPNLLADLRDHLLFAQALVIGMDFMSEFGYSGYTLKPPKFTDLNEWYSRQVYYTPFTLRVQDRGIAMLIDTNDSSLNLRPLKSEVLIKKLFERAGLTPTESQAGLITKRIIEHMDGLEGCRVFKITGVRKLINSLTKEKKVTRSQAKIIILDQDSKGKASLDRHKDLRIQFKEGHGPTTNDEVFDFLLDNELFMAGIDFKCPNCNIATWLQISNLSDKVKCEYCSYEYQSLSQLKDRGDWKFRKSGLLGRDNNQEGAIPVILTLMQLMRRVHDFTPTYTSSLKLKSQDGSVDCEVDFAMLSDKWSRRDKPQIAIGECKNNDEITETDIKNLLAVKALLDKSGFETYVVFSKLAQFSKKEKNLIKKHFKDKSPIMFTDTELEPYDPYEGYRKETEKKLRHPYATNFEEMAINSRYLYLEDDKPKKPAA
jgi:hypothetical protein